MNILYIIKYLEENICQNIYSTNYHFLDKGVIKEEIRATLYFLSISIFTSIMQIGLSFLGFKNSYTYNLLRQIFFRIQISASIFVLPAFVNFVRTLGGDESKKYVKRALNIAFIFFILSFCPFFIDYKNYVPYVKAFLQPKSGVGLILFLLWAGIIFIREILFVVKSKIKWRNFLAFSFIVASITGFIDGINSLQYTNIPTAFESGLTFANLGISLIVIRFFIEIYNENKRLNREIIKKELLEREISIARKIQENILPEVSRFNLPIKLEHYYSPAKQISGDFFDIFIFDSNKVGIAIGDVSGKNIPAALFMAVGINIIRTMNSIKDLSPSELLYYANNLIYNESRDGMFITLFYGIIDTKKKIFSFSSAGHNEQFLYKSREKKLITMKPKGIPLGVMKKVEYEEKKINIYKNDLIFLYTDGISEALNINNEEFGEKRVVEFIRNNYLLEPEEFKKKFLMRLDKFTVNQETLDDKTFLIAKI